MMGIFPIKKLPDVFPIKRYVEIELLFLRIEQAIGLHKQSKSVSVLDGALDCTLFHGLGFG